MIEKYKSRADFADAMIDKYFTKLPSNIVSDIGAGFGHMQNKVEKEGFIWQPFDCYKKIEKSIIWNLNNPFPLNAKKAGGILFLEVLEHLGNPQLGLKNIANHIDKNGVLILTTPNPQSSKNTLSLFLKGSLYAFQPKHLAENHVFTPWKHIVSFFLEQEGFKIIEYAIVDTSYHDTKPSSFKDLFKRWAEKLIERRNPEAQGMSYGIVALKK
jgi:2-polyprenyl-3-methyl-5-hydroxy-6-metoxy-1,4-benzoquinol methylase